MCIIRTHLTNHLRSAYYYQLFGGHTGIHTCIPTHSYTGIQIHAGTTMSGHINVCTKMISRNQQACPWPFKNVLLGNTLGMSSYLIFYCVEYQNIVFIISSKSWGFPIFLMRLKYPSMILTL